MLTTHVGSLARPDDLIPLLRLKERGQPYDHEAFARLVREAVAEVVRKQVEAGIDIVTDGEQGKSSFYGYIVERFSGFERKPAAPGKEGSPRAAGREYLAFSEYYAWSERIAAPFGGRGGGRTLGIDTCTGPVSYRGHAAVQADIQNLKTALKGRAHQDVFMPAIASSYVAASFANEYYRTYEEYEQAVSDAVRDRRLILAHDEAAHRVDGAGPEKLAESPGRDVAVRSDALHRSTHDRHLLLERRRVRPAALDGLALDDADDPRVTGRRGLGGVHDHGPSTAVMVRRTASGWPRSL
jgi:5-methyltetrahydropteroyltriglutamate--homocysteine methyltransferase